MKVQMSNVSRNELSGDEDMERKENKQKKSMTYGIAISDDKSNSFPCRHLRDASKENFLIAKHKKERKTSHKNKFAIIQCMRLHY